MRGRSFLKEVDAINLRASGRKPCPQLFGLLERIAISSQNRQLLKRSVEIQRDDTERFVEQGLRRLVGLGLFVRDEVREVDVGAPVLGLGDQAFRPQVGEGNFVILQKLLKLVVIVDIFRIDSAGQLAEHWDVVQTLPAPDYDPMRQSSEDFTRFRALYGMTPASNVSDS